VAPQVGRAGAAPPDGSRGRALIDATALSSGGMIAAGTPGG
jgi:hypothetical protein